MERLTPLEVTANDYICGACHSLLQRDTTPTSQDSPDMPTGAPVGHQQVCVGCGCSLLRT